MAKILLNQQELRQKRSLMKNSGKNAHNKRIEVKNIIYFFILICGVTHGQTELKGEIIIPEGKEISKEGIILDILKDEKYTQIYEDRAYSVKNLERNKKYLYQLYMVGFLPEKGEFTTSSDSMTTINIEFKMECRYTAEDALSDWNKGEPRLLSTSGLAWYRDLKTEIPFEKKYNIKYYDFGCNGPDDTCLIQYNAKIFELMDSKYGKEWRKGVKSSILH